MKSRLCFALLLSTAFAPTALAQPLAPPDATQSAEQLVTLKFEDVPIVKALELLAAQTGLQILIAGDVTGTLDTLAFKDATPEIVLQRLVAVAGLQSRRFPDGSYIVARQISEVTEPGDAPQAAVPLDAPGSILGAIRLRHQFPSTAQKQIQPPPRQPMPNEFPLPPEIAAKITGLSLPEGVLNLVPLDAQKVLLVQFRDAPIGRRGFQEISRLVADLDRPTPQLEIEGQFVRLKAERLPELGVRSREPFNQSVALHPDWKTRLQTLARDKRVQQLGAPRVLVLNNLTGQLGAPNAPTVKVTPTVNNDETITLVADPSAEDSIDTVTILREGEATARVEAQPDGSLILIILSVRTVGAVSPLQTVPNSSR